MKANSKGQTAMLELLVGSLLVLIVLIAILNSFESTFSSAQAQGQFVEIQQASARALQGLIRTTGLTTEQKSAWEEDAISIENVQTIGLAKRPSVLSEAKLLKFLEFANFDSETPESYYKTKEKIGLGKYDFSVSVLVREGVRDKEVKAQTSESFLEMGKSDADMKGIGFSSIIIERAVLLDAGKYNSSEGEEKIINYDPVIFRLKVYASQ
ncbi:hypothetical protein KKE06_03935 [Candidatus Micrarchaeota archaeon]|nr:hypothetical protein [Candidatus Micrarchaeota archaeon]MBU1930810.1 hypothetical protein [Candidatus Micrarchaeota archaeon]